MAHFTPGPWRDEAVTTEQAERMRGPLPQDFLVVGSDQTVIGVLYDYAGRVESNARLIAAALDLYAALKEARDVLSGAGYSTREFNAALAKAEGRER